MKKIDIVSFIMILALLLFFSVGVVLLYFIISSENEITLATWPIPIVCLSIPYLLAKDFITDFCSKLSTPTNTLHYTF